MKDQQKATLTEKDFQILEGKFATKKEFSELKKEFKELKTEFNELKTEVAEIKSILHEIVFELKLIREEISALVFRNSDHKDTLENHEGRITCIEDKLNFS